MKKSLIVLISILALLVIIIGYGISINNKMVNADEAVMSQWAKVENQYQRRADLIPNLVNTVKGYASHEKETLDAVVNARAKATQVTISPDNLNEASLQKYQAAQGELSQAQLEGTENRISTERTRYTDMVRDYNAMIRRFPASIIAGIGGFDKKPQFTAEAGAEKAPEVKF